MKRFDSLFLVWNTGKIWSETGGSKIDCRQNTQYTEGKAVGNSLPVFIVLVNSISMAHESSRYFKIFWIPILFLLWGSSKFFFWIIYLYFWRPGFQDPRIRRGATRIQQLALPAKSNPTPTTHDHHHSGRRSQTPTTHIFRQQLKNARTDFNFLLSWFPW